MVVILITVLAQNNMSRKCFITFLTTTAQTERSDSNPRLQPRCLRSSHTSLLRRKVAKLNIVSAHADVSSNPRATNASKHCWIQNEAKWFDGNEVRSRKPRRATDVDPPIQNVTVWAAHQSRADETVDGFVAGFTKRFSRKLVQDPKVSVQSTWRYFRVASVPLRQALQK